MPKVIVIGNNAPAVPTQRGSWCAFRADDETFQLLSINLENIKLSSQNYRKHQLLHKWVRT